MRNYVRNEHWKNVPWLIGLLLVIDVVARGHIDIAELIVFTLGLLALCAAFIGLDVTLDQVRPGRRRF